MTTFVPGSALASYLGAEESPQLNKIAELTNNLVADEWAHPVSPVPAWVTNIAWAVAIRAGTNPNGLTSSTKAWDDVTVTQRWEAGQFGINLTAEEKTALNQTNVAGPSTVPASVGSVRLSVPGLRPPPEWPVTAWPDETWPRS